MPRGMRRTTIMSHGRVHDAKGVKGTHLKGTTPTPTVMNAIPVEAGAVGNLPETAAPGVAGETPAGRVQTKVSDTRAMRMDQCGHLYGHRSCDNREINNRGRGRKLSAR